MNKQSSSYKQIIKSTSIFGGVQIINNIIGLVRNKFIAVVLGKAGLGVISIYQSVIDLAHAVSSLGIDMTGIRDIASEAGNEEKQAEKISMFKWWVHLTSILGAAICIIFCYPISIWGFGDESHALEIALLSFCVFFTTMAMGQNVILRGLRKISSMAISGVLGNLVALLATIPLYYFFGIKGILPGFIISTFTILFFATKYVRKIDFKRVKVENSIAYRNGLANLKFGLFVLGGSIINNSSMFFIKSFIGHRLDIGEVGIFQSVSTITMVYIALILKAMGNDYFPRLCSIAGNNFTVRRLVNQQTYIAAVIAIPVIVGMFSFSSLVLHVLYTDEFITGTTLMRWYITGSFFKLLSWPMAFILLAKGKGIHYFIAETLFFLIYTGFSYFLFPYFGLNAIGVAYLISYVIYLVIIFAYAIKLCQFRWSKQNLSVCIAGIIFLGVALLIAIYFDNYQIIGGIALTLISIIFAFKMLNKVIDIPEAIREIKDKIFHKK